MKRIAMISKNMTKEKAIKILAKTMYKDLLKNDFSNTDIINFTRELIENINFKDYEKSYGNTEILAL